jgi:tRNA(Ile)-lysidine synthase
VSVARSVQAQWIATGHTADDQAETVLHHLIRGSGLRGLCGIPRRRPLGDGIEIVRPLLGVRRQDVMRFLSEKNLAYRHDLSNTDRKYTRNRIRHDLLTLLAEQYNPAIVEILNHLALQADEWSRTEEAEASRLLERVELSRAGSMLVFDRKGLRDIARHRVRELFRVVWRREHWPMGEMGYADWERLAAVALGEATAVNLPCGISARCREFVVQITRTE